MNSLTNIASRSFVSRGSERQSVADLLEPLNRLAAHSPNLLTRSAGRFEAGGESYELPRYLFIGPSAGDDPIRIGLFAGIHGDEPEGIHALTQLLSKLEQKPELAAGYCLFVYPVCNPTGFEDGTRHSRAGRDLNREFWRDSSEPEVVLLQEELWAHSFHGVVSLHTDDTSHGVYGYASGPTLTRHLLEPALAAASQLLPRNLDPRIDGFPATQGIISAGYGGILAAPPKLQPRPFEIILESPKAAPEQVKHQALVRALESILEEYRRFIAYARNL